MDYIPTGNQMISLPCIRESDAAIEDFTFLHMGSKGMIDVRGGENEPLLSPYFMINKKKAMLNALTWSRIDYWIPAFTAKAGETSISGVILAPIDERGFVLQLKAENIGQADICAEIGWSFCWGETLHAVNENKPIDAPKFAYKSNWNNGVIFDMRIGLPLFAFAPMAAEEYDTNTKETKSGMIRCSFLKNAKLAPGETLTFTMFWGLGYEEVAAATSAKEMLRQGFENELNKTRAWLRQRSFALPDAALAKLYNENLFFCIFFSTGITLDTEELVLVTSRSPRYYVSAAYWDRDSLLWAFPAILDADAKLAREMLLYVFGRQRRNIGVHSRFIDGTVLEPGFELDELIAPIIALERYTDKTDDKAILERGDVTDGIAQILNELSRRKHAKVPLFSTFLQPTDDEIVYPYLTYDNALVWRGLTAIEKLFGNQYRLPVTPEAVKQAVLTHTVRDFDGVKRFIWSIDLNGNSDVYDEPPGSLLLLPYYGFCAKDDPVWLKTAAHIRSADYAYSFANSPIAEIGCPHAPHPWILSLANSMLCGHAETAFKHLRLAKMDNGIACEAVDENTGECVTGAAFATCAGFLCHALRTVFEKESVSA